MDMSVDKSNRDKDLKRIRYCWRPGLLFPILMILVFIAPYLWLFVDTVEVRYNRLFMLALIIGLDVRTITLTGTLHTIGMRRSEKKLGII